MQGGWVRRCPADGSEHYPRTDPAVIMAVVDADDRCCWPAAQWGRGRFSVLAGFVEPGESLGRPSRGRCARRSASPSATCATSATSRGRSRRSLMVGFTPRRQGTDLHCRREIEARDGSPATSWSRRSPTGRRGVRAISIARGLIEHWFGGPLDSPEIPQR